MSTYITISISLFVGIIVGGAATLPALNQVVAERNNVEQQVSVLKNQQKIKQAEYEVLLSRVDEKAKEIADLKNKLKLEQNKVASREITSRETQSASTTSSSSYSSPSYSSSYSSYYTPKTSKSDFDIVRDRSPKVPDCSGDDCYGKMREYRKREKEYWDAYDRVLDGNPRF